MLHKLSFGEAIEQDLLTDYQVVVVGIDNPSYSSMITERTLVKTDTDIQSDAQSFASHIGLAKAIKNYDLTRVISFHSRVSSARDFANKLPEVIDWMPSETKPDGELLTNHVSGAMPTNERNKNLQALGNITDDQRYILSNARCLSEGVDVPALDGVAFIDPRNSEIDIVQAVGRAIRLSKGKAIGSIVIPVFIEDHEDPDEVLNSSPFKKVWAVVNALRSHDEGLGEELDQLRQAMGKRGTVGTSDKIVFDLPTTITHQFETALKTKIIESTTASWEFWFGLLENYKEKHGDCFVSRDYRTDLGGHSLGTWVNSQRTQYKKNSLLIKYVDLLSDLGFTWDLEQYRWEQGYSELVIFKNKYGDCLVKENYRSIKGYNLHNWVTRQRSLKDTLGPEKTLKLDRLGFCWDVMEYNWESNFKELEIYKKNYGDCLVSGETHRKLSAWVTNQRRYKNTLTPSQLERLDNLGFNWNPHEQLFLTNLNELEIYKNKYGNCLVNGTYKTSSGLALGYWVINLRRRKSNLSAQQISLLDKMGFPWDLVALEWDTMIDELKKYKEIHGDCNVKTSSQHRTKLSTWVSKRRSEKNSLTSEQINQLDEMGFIWDANSYKWDMQFNGLVVYKQEFGDCLVPMKYKTSSGDALGFWVSTQRKSKKSLKSDRIRRLDEIGFVWNTK